MKKLIVFLFVVSAFASCKKKEEVKPQEPAQAVAGTYTLNSFRLTTGGETLDLPKLPTKLNDGSTVSGTVTLTPESGTTDQVSMVLALEVDGKKDETDFGTVEVRKTSEGYGLYADNELVADADGTTIIFNYSEYNSQTKETSELAFVAKK